MPSHKKVPLKSIKTLTFYKDKLTNARRVDPVPQLTCSGSTCKLYQPEVVQCVNMGDDGFGGVQWRCDTDLPSSLRLGKVDVSCEGWTKSGDMNVLQGSCGLTYDLHKVNKGLEYGEDPIRPSRNNSLFDQAFNLLFWLISLIILYSLLRSLIARFFPRYTPPRISRFLPFLGPDGPSGPGGPGGGGGGGPGFNPGSGGSGAPPPPYTKNPPQTQTQGQTQSWGPGFWTGLAAGGLGTYLANQRNTQNVGARNVQPSRIRRFDDDDNDDWYRDVGPSRRRAGGNDEGLGEIRRATGFGGSSTR
ncbi:uncharacterized protein I206_101406 [Kwoniella pini CBS 10737]|uniref:Store-operated calcium entry-associated regulatory factor n=1 Tax=Kwoniella pini CBS 10737 TaxID=1296096 RepID=A0A1B9HWU6_9TREE|nr:uncharacterized protein I206_06624 [Kwoniella pini CBS 10737]OCF47718.1 hypothetical protein I206_06624 [Kwoniella pini CBS 10737]